MKGRNIGHTLYRIHLLSIRQEGQGKDNGYGTQVLYWKMKLSQFKHMRLLTPVSKGGRGKYQGALGEKNFFCFFIGI